LSKRLKKRIQELCGFLNLKREEKLRKANEILKSTELKQAICNQILGASFKDIEKTMMGIINERQLTEEQEEQIELEQLSPEKFDLELDFKLNKSSSDKSTMESKSYKYRTYTMAEVNALLEASRAETPIIKEHREAPAVYESMPREMAERLVREHYEYLAKEQNRKKEQWDSEKMTELEIKIASTMKHTKSIKT
jgi:hypothetical protein